MVTVTGKDFWDIAYLPNGSIIIMDNVAFHHGVHVKDMMTVRGFQWHYLPAYSPFFNPIENMFSMWKHYVKSVACESEEELFAAIHAAADRITAEHCTNIVNHVGSNCFRCINGERILS